MNGSCIVLNGDFTYLCTVSWKRALKLALAGKVRVLKYSDMVVRCVGNAFKVPAVVSLIRVVRMVYRNRVPFSKRNVLARDGRRCVYCGKIGGELTIDHVIPKSRGGKTDFDNCVTCCGICNEKKGARTPSEAGMFLRKQPFQPTVSEFMRLKLRQSGIPDYLADLGVL